MAVMILEKQKTRSPRWQKILSQAITNPQELLNLLEIEHFLPDDIKTVMAKFPLKVPRGFVAKMQAGDLHDPLLRQVLPISEELHWQEGYSFDAVGDQAAKKMPGLIHKYQGRVLFILAGSCAINCRFCFRREFPYADNNPGQKGWQKALDYIRADPSIEEVIFSGGEPLLLPDKILASLAHKIAAISHVKILRIHTRLPIVIPERITKDFLTWFTGTRLKSVMSLHCNHPNEIDATLAKALLRAQKAGVTLLNQAVLLKGVNDAPEILMALSKKLFAAGVLPYYLNLLDKVQGAAHFEVPLTRAKQLMREISAQLPGYLVPKLIQEEAGKSAKSVVAF